MGLDAKSYKKRVTYVETSFCEKYIIMRVLASYNSCLDTCHFCFENEKLDFATNVFPYHVMPYKWLRIISLKIYYFRDKNAIISCNAFFCTGFIDFEVPLFSSEFGSMQNKKCLFAIIIMLFFFL